VVLRFPIRLMMVFGATVGRLFTSTVVVESVPAVIKVIVGDGRRERCDHPRFRVPLKSLLALKGQRALAGGGTVGAGCLYRSRSGMVTVPKAGYLISLTGIPPCLGVLRVWDTPPAISVSSVLNRCRLWAGEVNLLQKGREYVNQMDHSGSDGTKHVVPWSGVRPVVGSSSTCGD
jgi:hypothetical protein